MNTRHFTPNETCDFECRRGSRTAGKRTTAHVLKSWPPSAIAVRYIRAVESLLSLVQTLSSSSSPPPTSTTAAMEKKAIEVWFSLDYLSLYALNPATMFRVFIASTHQTWKKVTHTKPDWNKQTRANGIATTMPRFPKRSDHASSQQIP